MRFCCGRPAASSQGWSASARNRIEDLTGHIPLDRPQVGSSYLRGRHAGAGIHLHRDERLTNPTRSDSIDAQATGTLRCRRAHKAFEASIHHPDGRAPGHRLSAQDPCCERERASIREQLDAEADQINLAHEFVGEANGEVGVGESEQRTKGGLACSTDHGVHPAKLRVEARDRLWIRQIYRKCRAGMAGAEDLVLRRLFSPPEVSANATVSRGEAG